MRPHQDTIRDQFCSTRSFPAPGDAEKIRRAIVDALADDGLGTGTERRGDEIDLVYPVGIFVADR